MPEAMVPMRLEAMPPCAGAAAAAGAALGAAAGAALGAALGAGLAGAAADREGLGLENIPPPLLPLPLEPELDLPPPTFKTKLLSCHTIFGYCLTYLLPSSTFSNLFFIIN